MSILLVLPTRAEMTSLPLHSPLRATPSHSATQTYIGSTPTTGPWKQQAAPLWPPQLSKQPLWAVVPALAPRQSKSP